MASRARSTGSGAHGAPAPPHYRSIPLEPKWLRYLRPGGGKGRVIEPSSTTALHPPAPAPCAATSAARRAPPPRSRTALGFARSALGARPRVGREGEGAFSNTHIFTFSTPPRRVGMRRGKSGSSARLPAGRHKIRRAVLARALPVYARTPVPFFLPASSHFIDTGTFVGSRPPSAPVLYALHQHRYFSWIAQFFSTGTFGCFERDDARY